MDTLCEACTCTCSVPLYLLLLLLLLPPLPSSQLSGAQGGQPSFPLQHPDGVGSTPSQPWTHPLRLQRVQHPPGRQRQAHPYRLPSDGLHISPQCRMVLSIPIECGYNCTAQYIESQDFCLCLTTYSIALIFRGSKFSRFLRIWRHSRKYLNENFDTSHHHLLLQSIRDKF